MARTRDKDILEMAETVDKLFTLGKTSLSVKEIGDFHFGGKALSEEWYELIRKRLHRIRDVLKEDYKHEVVLLSDTYFACYRNSPPKDMEEARRCLPMGNGNRAEGLQRQTNKDDLIWQSNIEAGFASGTGKVKKSANRVVTAVQNGKLGASLAANILEGAEVRSQPDNSLLAQQIKSMRDNQTLLLESESGKSEEEVPGSPE